MIEPHVVVQIRNVAAQTQYTHAKIGEMFGITAGNVSQIVRGVCYSRVGGPIRKTADPFEPKGFSKKALAWAKRTPGNREAALILAMHSGRPAPIYGPHVGKGS